MTYDENGAPLKRCERCGRLLAVPDWYAAIRTKYCKACAADAKREQTAQSLRRLRAKARERRKLERQRADLLADENEILRQAVRELEARLDRLKAERGGA